MCTILLSSMHSRDSKVWGDNPKKSCTYSQTLPKELVAYDQYINSWAFSIVLANGKGKIMFSTDRKNGESYISYVKRLTENKKEMDLDYQEWAKLICDYDCSSDNGRKAYYIVKRLVEKLDEEYTELVASSQTHSQEMVDELLLELELKKQELYKERVKLNDIKSAMKREARPEARWEVAMDMLYSSISELPPIKMKFATDDKGSNEASVLISDVHIGKGVDTPHNTYNLEIAKERLEKLATQVIHFAKLHQVGTLNIDFLGDLIENNIHISARVEQVCDLMEQVAYASEYLSQFVSMLAPHFNGIRLHSVAGNHDRNAPNYKESRECENFVRIIDTMIELRTGLKFERSNVDTEIEVYTLKNGHTVALQHGHNVKNVDNLVKDTSFYLDMNIDFCHIGHFHNFKAVKGTVCNGSVCGSDKYANKLRFNDKASQVLAVYYEDGTQVLHNIILN